MTPVKQDGPGTVPPSRTRTASATIRASVYLAAVVALTGNAGTARRPDGDAGLPAEGRLHPSGHATTIHVGRHTADLLRIRPVTFTSRPGTNPSEGSKRMCGLIIATPGGSPQGVVTGGTGPTEASPSCDAVLAVGAVPPANGGAVRRIVAIHAVSSRNAADGRTVVVLRRNGRGTWSVDEDATARADSLAAPTIRAVRADIARSR